MNAKQKKAQLRYWIQRERFLAAQNSKNPKRIASMAETLENAFADMQNAVEPGDRELFQDAFLRTYGTDMRKGMRSSY